MPERVADEILRFIETEALKPEDRLPSERELAELLGVSRPSVREGVKFLEARGYLDVRRGQGVFIQRPPLYEGLRKGLDEAILTVNHLFDMREALEVPAAGWAAKIGDEEALGAVEDALRALNAKAAEPVKDWSTLQDLDVEFHMRIAAAADNPFLDQTLGVLNDLIREGMRTTIQVEGRLEKSRHDHEAILHALKTGDEAGARAAARRHIRAAYRTALRANALESPEAPAV
ncbi:FadR/GntR family transcriptional regulator [Microbacterium sp. EST19A]|uniref:FadR/GntR family transcriptional regulator n=1 Tax=Microbacterium sp. EST19A TaxID=2862681 RepID=UPI001CBCB314|nr:FCD domain-containing protein [Microbacterium sp. EST19A]